MAVGPQEPGSDPGRVTAQNMDSKYTRQTFAPEKGADGKFILDIDKTQLRWESYVKAGYFVCCFYLGRTERKFSKLDLKRAY
jgi:hypothetical protein